MDTKYLTPFADWLSISYPTSMSPHLQLVSYFNELSMLIYKDLGGSKESYTCVTGGSVFITSKDTYTNISMSGSILQLARDSGRYTEFQTILASSPYNITRLDCAYDFPLDGHLTMSRIDTLYPDGNSTIASRSRQIRFVTSRNLDRKRTGTCYFQSSKYKGTIKLRVYDKAHEVYERQNIVIPPTTRYELSVARGASLADFHNPTNLFWHFIPTELLKPSKGVFTKPWVATERIIYDDYSTSGITEYESLKWLIQTSPALLQLVRATKNVNGGDMLLKREIAELLSKDAQHVAQA